MKNEHELINQVNHQLRTRVRELEGNMTSYDSVANKSTLTIASLQKDSKEKQDQLLELQSRIRYGKILRFLFSSMNSSLCFRIHMEEREGMERRTGHLMNKLQELFVQLGVTMATDFGQPSATAFDKLMNRVRVIFVRHQYLH